MFNLLVFTTDWKSDSIKIDKRRVFEHTELYISKEFKTNDHLNIDILKYIPCLFCNEGIDDELIYFGYINSIKDAGISELSLKIKIDNSMPVLTSKIIYNARQELFIKDFEFNRNHWSIKDIDLYKFIMKITEHEKEKDSFILKNILDIDIESASAMMPFDKQFDEVYNSIVSSFSKFEIECKRVDKIWEHEAIIDDIIGLIKKSKIVVCDCTRKNPNVFYEMGIAHTLRRNVIIITQNETDIPFDVRHIKYIKYLNNTEGLLQLEQKLESRIKTLIST